MYRKMKGVNKFRIDPEHLRKMLEKQKESQIVYQDLMCDGTGGVQEIPGFLTIQNGPRKSITGQPIGSDFQYQYQLPNFERVREILEKYLQPYASQFNNTTNLYGNQLTNNASKLTK